MLRQAVTQQNTAQLSIRANNWALHNRNWRDLCIHKFGDSGQELRDMKHIPLSPFAERPTPYDLQCHSVSGEPMPGRYIYARKAINEEEEEAYLKLDADERKDFLDNRELSTTGQNKKDRDDSVYSTSLAERKKTAEDLLTELLSGVSPESKSAILLHRDYESYITAPHHKRSLKFYLLMHSLHRVGDASIKHLRTAELIQGSQGTRSFEEWVDWLNTNFEQFVADFEDPDNRGYISCAEFKSFLFLHGTDRKRYRVVYDEQLRGNASGRFPDTDTLIRNFQEYDNRQKMSVSEPASTQANAYAATFSPPEPSTTNNSGRPRTYKIACSFCLAAKGHHSNFGHLAAECHKNPASPGAQKLLAEKTQKHAFVSSDERFDKLEAAVTSLTMLLSGLQSDPSPETFTDTQPGPPLPAEDRMDRLERAVASILSKL
jgi:hypothetical protein